MTISKPATAHGVGPSVAVSIAAAVAAVAAFAVLPSPAAAATLYDPAAGSLPSAQGWTALNSTGASFNESVAGGRLLSDTLAAEATSHGWARIGPGVLDTAAGFVVTIDARVLAETHSTVNRAGFSLVAIGQTPSKSIELAFWADRVFAYGYDASSGDRFVHGAEALIDTASAARVYTLTVQNQQYSLSTGVQQLLAGALVDYTQQGQPYTVPNVLFFGDDTSRASSSVSIGAVTLSPVSEPAAAWLLAFGATAVGGLRALRRRRSGSAAVSAPVVVISA